MPRELWAKIYVNLRQHPKLIGRPDADFRLWTCLILHAKEHCPDGVVRELTPSDMRGAFGIKAPLRVVEEALEYFVNRKMLVEVEGGLLIRDFAERQAKYGDTPEAHAERQRLYKQRHRSDVTGRNGMTSSVTSSQLSQGDADLEIRDQDLEKEEKTKNGSSSFASSDRAREATPTEQARVKHALGLDQHHHRRGPADVRDLVGGITQVAQTAAAKRTVVRRK